MISKLLKPVFDIHPEERLKTFLMFLYFFFTIALIYILKPVRNALVITELGAQNLRFVYMGEGIFLIFVVWGYLQMAKRVSKKMLYDAGLIFFIACLVGFWFLFRGKAPYLSAYFYIWVAAFSITMTTQFWTLANDIFTPDEGKRLFGVMISSGSIGGILGGFFTAHAVQWFKAEDLLLVAAAVVGICLVIVNLLWKQVPNLEKPAIQSPSHKLAEESGLSSLKIFLGSPYFMMLAGLVMISKMASTIIDNQFSSIVELAISGKEARTAFFGGFLAWLNILSFLMQFAMTGFCLQHLGVGRSLVILPVGLAIMLVPSLWLPLLATAIPLRLFDGSVNYSIQQASKEILYLPVSSEKRYRVKPIIDMLGFRLAKTMAGVYIAIAAPLFAIPHERLGILVFCLIPFWAALVWWVNKECRKLSL